MKKNILVLACFVLLLSCSNQEEYEVPPNHHPNLNLVLNDSTKFIEISRDEIQKWDDHFSIELTDTLAIDITEDRFKINSVADVLIKDNEILIVDDGASVVHSVDFNGNPGEPVAVTGRGPGEVTSPINIDKKESGYAVMDIVNGVIHFDKNNEVVKNEHLEFMPDSFCMLDNYFIKSSYYFSDKGVDNHLIFEVDQNNQIVNKYSQKYDHENDKLNYFMASGPAHCVDSKNLLVNSYTMNMPLLELFKLETGESVRYKLDINPYTYEFEKNTLSPSEINFGRTYHRHRSTSVIEDRYVVLQYAEVDRPKDPDEEYDTQVLSYVFDLQDDQIYYSYNLPIIRTASEDKMFTESHTEDYKFGLYTYDWARYE